ncbi:MAG: primosomal protein N' [Lachnospiraceae bacterium]|nr:primosomal protein N' [Lachnospiraceae bacterium]
MTYADVIIDISLEKLDKTFQYLIPRELEKTVGLGTQVVIPFGKGERRIKGYVVELSEEPKIDSSRIKPICGVAKDSLPIESQLIALAGWMKRNYGSTMNQALKTVLPIKKKESIKEKKTVHLILSPEQAKVEFTNLVARKRHSVAKERLLEALMENPEIPWEEITGRLHIPSTVIRDFEKDGWVKITAHRAYRNPIRLEEGECRDIILNEEQQQVVDTVLSDWKQGRQETYLLYGVTGSGKTQVYMELIAKCLEQGRSAIVLIPEIALTYQTVMRFYGRFGSKVSIINSRMTPGERFDQFERAKNGDIQIMVGPRSALFTPFSNLGIIIIDEEHETSYKSETVPKYHARETAIARAAMNHATVVLGSATPSVESFARAKSGEYRMLTLTKRVEEKPLPECEIVDLRQELRMGNRSILSNRLVELMEERLAKGEQTMLFINRRGLMGFVSCRACGHVIKCPHCDVSLSLHRGNKMQCHYCGYEMEQPKVCPDCGSKYIGGFKAGTQKFEEVVKQRFPRARVLRMDMDTTRGKHGHQEILEAFSNEEADILIGTQMIVKGHDFPKVTLVGVLAADMSLNSSDFHSGERTFQLLTQAAGRAGRGSVPGQVVIQTYQPQHYSIVAASKQAYEDFFDREIVYRRMMGYPPAAHMLVIQINGPVEERAQRQAERIAELLHKTDPDALCMGPSDATIARVNDVYKKIIYIKDKDYEHLVKLKDAVEAYILEENDWKDVSVWFDFDPISGF